MAFPLFPSTTQQGVPASRKSSMLSICAVMSDSDGMPYGVL